MKYLANWFPFGRSALFLFGLTLLVGYVSAQNLTDLQWKKFAADMKSGCVEHQKGSAANHALQDGVIEETCDCMAQEVTRRAKASPELISAMRTNDRQAAQRLMPTITTDPNGRHVLLSCSDRVMAARGGLAGSTKKEARASTVKGLTGKSRSSFTDEFTRNCSESRAKDVATMQFSPGQVTGYCRCVAEGTADNVSPQDLLDRMKAKGVVSEFDKAVRHADKACTAKYLN